MESIDPEMLNCCVNKISFLFRNIISIQHSSTVTYNSIHDENCDEIISLMIRRFANLHLVDISVLAVSLFFAQISL